jgi:hypothetical protein
MKKLSLTPALSQGEKVSTLAGRMRNIMQNMKGRWFSPADISDILMVSSYKERRRVRNALSDFLRRGEIERTAPGRYVYHTPETKSSHMGTIWSLVRSARGWFSVDDIAALCPDIGRDIIGEYLRGWQEMGILGRLQDENKIIYRLAHDVGPRAPKNQPKADRLKRLRAKLGVAESMIRQAKEELESWSD